MSIDDLMNKYLTELTTETGAVVTGYQETATGWEWTVDLGDGPAVIFGKWELWAFLRGYRYARDTARFSVPAYSSDSARRKVVG